MFTSELKLSLYRISFFFCGFFTAYDLATQCESRRTSLRRHTIVGCQNTTECHSMPPSRPQSRQSEISAAPTSLGPSVNFSTTDTWTKNSLDEVSLTNSFRFTVQNFHLYNSIETMERICCRRKRSIVTYTRRNRSYQISDD